jgi:hypothetical protein
MTFWKSLVLNIKNKESSLNAFKDFHVSIERETGKKLKRI